MNNSIISQQQRELWISLYPGGAKDTLPRAWKVSWDTLFVYMTTVKLLTTSKILTPALSMAQFLPGVTRNNANVICSNGFIYDIDNKDPATGLRVKHPIWPEDLYSLGPLIKYAHWYNESQSSTPSHPRFHVGMPNHSSVYPLDFSRDWLAVQEHLGIVPYVDQAAKDPSRVMFEFYMKHIKNAFSGGVVNAPWIEASRFVKVQSPLLSLVTDPLMVRSMNQGENDIEKIQACLEVLNPDCSRADWLTVGMGVHHETNGVYEGFQLWLEWSMGGQKKYVGKDDCLDRWESFDSDKPNPTTLASVVDLAKKSGSVIPAPLITTTVPTTFAAMRDKFLITSSHVQNIQDAWFLYEKMIVGGHVMILVAEPNGGKTTIMEMICGEMVKTGKTVAYVNADTAPSEMKEAYKRSLSGGWDLWCPDYQEGLSMVDVIRSMKELLIGGEDLNQYVFIIDTLKTCTDMMQKKDLKGLLGLFRKLSSRGATVICLGHTNKRDEDGWPVYEGTGDLRADVDEMMLMIPHESALEERVVVSLYGKGEGWPGGKARAATECLSWQIDLHPERLREVTLLDGWTDTRAKRDSHKADMERDKVIGEIENCLLRATHPLTQTDLHSQIDAPRRLVVRVLKQFIDEKWVKCRGERNTYAYRIMNVKEDILT